jgi:excisionase family DNA binding protein
MTATSPRADYLKITEVAQMLGVTERTLYEWRRTGVLPAAKLGGMVRYRRSVIDARLGDLEGVHR